MIIHYLHEAANKEIYHSKRVNNNDKANTIINKQKICDSIYINKMFVVADNYYSLNEWKKLDATLKKLQQISKINNDINSLAKVYRYLGLLYENKSLNDSAFYYYTKSQKIYFKINNLKQVCLLYQDQAMIQYYINNFSDSESLLVKALKVANRIDCQSEKYRIYISLGLNAREQENYDSALIYFDKALKIFEEKKVNFHKFHYEYCINNIAYIYLLKKDYALAKSLFLKGLNNKSIYLDPVIYTRLTDNLVVCNMHLRIFKNAKRTLSKTYNFRDSLNIAEGQNFNRLYLSQYYAAIKDTANAKRYAIDAYNLSQDYRAPNDMMMCLKHLSKIDPANALKYTSEYVKLSDSMHQQERETRNKFAKIAYETEEITQEKETAEKQKSIFLGIAITVTAFGLLLLIVIAQRNRQKELLHAQSQQRAKEEIYQLVQTQQSKIDEGRQIEKKRIARELHDGVMNRLASTRFNLHILNNKKDTETVDKCLPFIDGLHEIEKEIRNIAHDLNTEVFSDNDSFKNILMTFVEEQKNVLKPKLHADIDKTIRWEAIESNVKINIYRILQESLQNISKHADAENIFLSITNQKHFLMLEVHDDGQGFNASQKKGGIGLDNIKARAKECKAIFHVDSGKGNGTTILVSIPLNKKRKL